MKGYHHSLKYQSFPNHLVWNSVSMEDGHKYHSNEQSYYMEVRKISDELCRKYGLSVIQTNQKKGIHYVQWKAEKEGKPTWRTAIRSDIRETVKASYSWTQFVKEMETRGYVWRTDRKYLAQRLLEWNDMYAYDLWEKDMEKWKSGSGS